MNAGRIAVAVGLALLAIVAIVALINGRSTIEIAAYVAAAIAIVGASIYARRRHAEI